jgi:orotidine-5'-phosphate decarboxylase
MAQGTEAREPELIVALDNCAPEEALTMARELGAQAGVRWFKVGLELYTRTGPALIAELRRGGAHVFLDLKLHDIPNTVAQSVRSAADTGADLLTVHCSGGPAMLEAAQKAAAPTSLKILGVTVLTSLAGADLAAIAEAWGARSGAAVPRGAIALRLAEHASQAGLPGIVCSASDLHDGTFGRLPWKQGRPLFVTPGIREAGAAAQDQKSVATVAQAVQAGATHLVVGRPITAPTSGTRPAAASRFLAQIKEATHGVTSHT